MSLPQPTCGEPLSPVHVLEVWLIPKCFPCELFHSCEAGFLIISIVQQFLYLIFQEEVWKQRAHTTIMLLWLNSCFSVFQEEVWCDEPTQPVHSSGWTPASEWGNPYSSNIQRFVWGEVWASGESLSRDWVLQEGNWTALCILLLDLTSGSGFATGLGRHIMHIEVKLLTLQHRTTSKDIAPWVL
jgi:hypothetical protein